MEQQSLGRKVILLSLLSVLGIAYSGFLYFKPTLTGWYGLDGIIGVVLGLYISSRPAAHLVEMLFYRRAMRYSFSSKRSLVLWLSLNVLVLFVSAMVIFVGTTRLISSPSPLPSHFGGRGGHLMIVTEKGYAQSKV